jgi:leucine dehydrogenase
MSTHPFSTFSHASPFVVLEDIRSKGFEQVSIWTDEDLGITGIISIHSTKMGPSLGGCRVYNYASVDEALYDVLRLSEGMTLKNALAGLPIGGGKGVIMASPEAMLNRRSVFLKFASWVDSLGGRYITAEDMGTSVEDVKVMQEITSHVSGTDSSKGGGGDPSPFTARGVYLGMKACAERVYGDASLSNKKILVQGVGSVGVYLCRHLKDEGAEILLSDISEERLQYARDTFSAEIVPLERMFETECDIFSPCAIGGIINEESASTLACRIVAGAANNQLRTPDCERVLQSRGIIYAPDFAVNAGGVIMCADEVGEGGYDRDRVDRRVSKIGQTIGEILDEARDRGLMAGEIAVEKAYRVLSRN